MVLSGCPAMRGHPSGHVDAVPPLREQHGLIENLRAGEKMHATQIELGVDCTLPTTSPMVSSSKPNGAGLPPMRMAPPCAEATGLTRIETGTVTFRRAAIAVSLAISSKLSR